MVSAVDAHVLYRDLMPGRRSRPRARRACAGSRRPARATCCCSACAGGPRASTGTTCCSAADYDAEFDALFGTGTHRDRPAPVADPTLYLHRDPAGSTGEGDDAREAVSVLVNAPPHLPDRPTRGIDWDAPGLADDYADRVLALLAARGVDVRDRVLTRTWQTPADLARRTGDVGGSIYGTATHGGLGPLRRPANATAVGGLFLVGGSTHPGGGLPMVGLSAEVVAGLVGPA